MSSKLKVLQVIPKLGYGGAETGCFDIAHYLYENNCDSFLITNGGPLTKFINNLVLDLGTVRLYGRVRNSIAVGCYSLLLSSYLTTH